MTEPCDLSIADAGAALRAGTLTAVELAESHLERIAARDETLRAFVHLDAESVLAQARQADEKLAEGEDAGPMHGIPVALKDLIDVEGLRTRCGSHVMAEPPAGQDADVVARLRAAGAVILGKVATYEFALTGPSFDQPSPPPRNPWNREHITGGSSSGSAAAVAGGLVRCALGTDTGGSVRSPSSYCGAVGLKPTYERVSRRGVYPLSDSLDHVGPLAASVADAAACFDALAEPADAPAATSLLALGLSGLRIGYARDWFAADPQVDPAAVEAMDTAASQLSLLGARIEPIALPDYELFEDVGSVLLQAEAFEIHKDKLRQKQADYGRAALRNLVTGAVLTAEDITAARTLARRLTAEMTTILDRYDALITINTLTTAPPFAAFASGEPVWTPMRTFPFNVTGHPALAVPMGFTRGLPLGMQIIGKHNDEARLCQIGHAFEQSTDHAVQRPPLPARSAGIS